MAEESSKKKRRIESIVGLGRVDYAVTDTDTDTEPPAPAVRRKRTIKKQSRNHNTDPRIEVMKFMRSEITSNNTILLEAIQKLQRQVSCLQTELAESIKHIKTHNSKITTRDLNDSPTHTAVTHDSVTHDSTAQYGKPDPEVASFYRTSYYC